MSDAHTMTDQPPPTHLPTRWLQDEHNKQRLFGSPKASPASSVDSINTYTSTLASQEDLHRDDNRPYNVPDAPLESYPDILPATSKDFAQLFPSTRRLHIRHDDSTTDGNMNLRIDTTVSPSTGRPHDVQLFHLRLHDLRSRDFSFRRYCRDSNREICHSSRRPQRVSHDVKSTTQRSLSQALRFLRPGSSHKTPVASTNLARHDSGYDSMDEGEPQARHTAPAASTSGPLEEDIGIEFSNYAQCVLRRRGPAKKHYDFDYWGRGYSWQRTVHKDGSLQHASFRLVRRKGGETIAHLVAMPLSEEQAREETEKGGWIPPCSMWLSDQATIDGAADVCDAVIATGLVALVDDSIRRRFHSKSRRQLVVPLSTLPNGAPNPNWVEPHRLIDETFGVSKPPVRRWTSG